MYTIWNELYNDAIIYADSLLLIQCIYIYIRIPPPLIFYTYIVFLLASTWSDENSVV